MKIKHLHLSNFRCFEDFDIDFNIGDEQHGGLTVLVAKNGEGKTAVLDALNIIYGPFITKLTQEKDSHPLTKDDNYISPKEGIQDYARLDATMLNPKVFKENHGYDDFHVIRYFDGLKESTKTEDHYHLTNFAKYIYDWRNGSDPWPAYAYYGEKRLYSTPSVNEIWGSEGSLEDNRLLGYKNARQPFIGYKNSQKWFNELSLYEFGERMKQQDGDSSFNAADYMLFTDLLSMLKQAVEVVMKPSGFTNIAYSPVKKELVAWSSDSFSRIPLSLLSAGTRVTLGTVIDLVYRCCKLNPDLGGTILQKTPGIVLIDEIELALHPAWQQQILPALQKIFPLIQFIVTTHSPQVVSSVPAECVRIIDTGKVYGALGSEGAEASRILEDIFCTSPYPKDNPQRVKLIRYLDLVYDGHWKDPEVLQMRKELDEVYCGKEPLLTEADLHIENEEWEEQHPADDELRCVCETKARYDLDKEE